MTRNTGSRLTWALALGLLAAGEVAAGPFFGKPACCDPCYPGPGTYSPLHYWVPEIYRIRAFYCANPPIDMYPPEHSPPVPFGYIDNAFPCPYATPQARYSRPGLAYYNGAQGPLVGLQTPPQAAPPSEPGAVPPGEQQPPPQTRPEAAKK